MMLPNISTKTKEYQTKLFKCLKNIKMIEGIKREIKKGYK